MPNFYVQKGSDQQGFNLVQGSTVQQVLVAVRELLELPRNLKGLEVKGYSSGKTYALNDPAPEDEVLVVAQKK